MPIKSAENYDGEPVTASAYCGPGSAYVEVRLPGRHVHPKVRKAAQDFGRVLSGAWAARQAVEEAKDEHQRLDGALSGEHQRHLLSGGADGDPLTVKQMAAHLSDAQHEREALERVAAGAWAAIRPAFDRLVSVVQEHAPEWSAYLISRTEDALSRVERARFELLDALTEACDLEGLRRLIDAGGVDAFNHRHHVRPIETEAKIYVSQVHEAVAAGHQAVREVLADAIKAQKSGPADFSGWTPTEHGRA